jgi:hypothetical protein
LPKTSAGKIDKRKIKAMIAVLQKSMQEQRLKYLKNKLLKMKI